MEDEISGEAQFDDIRLAGEPGYQKIAGIPLPDRYTLARGRVADHEVAQGFELLGAEIFEQGIPADDLVNLFGKASGFSQALKTGESVVTVIHDEDTTRENP